MSTSDAGNINFNQLISSYNTLQAKLKSALQSATKAKSGTTNPATFLLLQYQMSQVSQIGDSVSNLIAQIQGIINVAVRNQRVQ